VSKTYIKLKTVGEAATFTVARCAPGNGQYPDVEFEDGDGNVYAVPKASADKQLDRIGFPEYGDVVGRTITISRGENKKAPDKPFWNIDLASGANGNGRAASAARQAGGTAPHGGSAGTPSATAQPRPASRQDVERILDAEPVEKKPSGYALYKQITAQVLKDIPNMYHDHGVAVDGQTIAAIVATLYINATRNGH
jgi:hypothetical protein